MTKKNLSLSRRNSENDILGYRLPEYHPDGKKVYVDFYAFDPTRGEMRRKKIHLDKYKSKAEKKRHAAVIINTLTHKLLSGWNPWCEASASRSFTPFDDILDRYLEYAQRKNRAKTTQNYTSKCKILRTYNEQRYSPIRYAYQYDTQFINEFLDWIYLDLERGARTRNNYKGWCYSLGEFLRERKYIDTNPAAGIAKLPETEKKRKPLTRGMLSQMQKHLKATDPHFLLAVMMEYYTFIRPMELSHVRLADINIKEQRVFISKEVSKNKRDGYVGINRTLLKMMLELGVFNYPSHYYLFGRGFKPSGTRANPDIFNKRWVTMRKILKWGEEFQFYSLKDTGIRDLANAEGIVIARDQARHTDITTTNKYLGADKQVREETKTFTGGFE